MNILHEPANRMSANVYIDEIDDDDEDVIQVAVEVSNRSSNADWWIGYFHPNQ